MGLDPNTHESDIQFKKQNHSSEPKFSISTVMTIIAAVASVLGAWYLLSTRVALTENDIKTVNAVVVEIKKKHEKELTALESKHDTEVKELEKVIRELELKNAELSAKINP